MPSEKAGYFGEGIEIDNVIGAYTSTLELRDGRVLVVYYTEGAESHVRAKRFKLTATGIAFVPW